MTRLRELYLAVKFIYDIAKMLIELADSRKERKQEEAIEKLKESKPGTKERRDGLRDWVDSN